MLRTVEEKSAADISVKILFDTFLMNLNTKAVDMLL